MPNSISRLPRTLDTTFAASKECPPNSKKLSWIPIRSNFRTSPHSTASRRSMGVRGAHANVYYALGYSGHGIMASAGGSRIVVDTLLGRIAPADNPFRPQREMVERPLDIL